MAEPASAPAPRVGAAVLAQLDRTWAIIDYEARKLRRDPSELLLRAVQPALWLLIFGEVFSTVHVIPTGRLTYLEFLAPGILCQSVLFIAIFYGIASIRERELGIAYKFLVSPASRLSLVSGKALSASLRGLSQAVIVYLLAIGLGVGPSLAPLDVLGVLVAVILGSCIFAALSMIIASIVQTQERFLGIGQLMTMPLFFASSAIYPLSIMPAWLRPVALANPLTYLVDAVRTLMIPGATGLFPLGLDFAVLVAVAVAFLLIESRLYPRLAQ
jgi:ABC-2 type transport system permease protein